jgi:hypothetical protein
MNDECVYRDWPYEPFCETHQCGATDEVRCGKVSCPHCVEIHVRHAVRVLWDNRLIEPMIFLLHGHERAPDGEIVGHFTLKDEAVKEATRLWRS